MILWKIILATIGFLLMAGPFIGLILDLKKSKKYVTALSFAGILILGLSAISFFNFSISTIVILAFCIVPILFLYVLLANKINKQDERIEENKDEIID